MAINEPKTGTPLQALRFSLGLHNGMGERFLTDWLADKPVSHWMIATSPVKDTSANVPATISFHKFCELNPDITDQQTFNKFVVALEEEFDGHNNSIKDVLANALHKTNFKLMEVK